MGNVRWTVFREAKPFPLEGATLVETFFFFGSSASRFHQIRVYHLILSDCRIVCILFFPKTQPLSI